MSVHTNNVQQLATVGIQLDHKQQHHIIGIHVSLLKRNNAILHKTLTTVTNTSSPA